MTQKELVREISEKTGLSLKDVRQVLITLSDIIERELSRNGTVKIQPLGVFKTKKRAAKKAVLKGKIYDIPERYVPVLSFSSKIVKSVSKTK